MRLLPLTVLCGLAAAVEQPSPEHLLQEAVMYGSSTDGTSYRRNLQQHLTELNGVKIKKLADNAYVVRYEEGAGKLLTPIVRYVLLNYHREQWWPRQRVNLPLLCDNVASYHWNGTVLQLRSATGQLLGDLAIDGSSADAPQYVQLRYQGFDDAVQIEVQNTLDIPVRLLPGLFIVYTGTEPSAECNKIYIAKLQKECVLHPHEPRQLALPLSTGTFNSPQRVKQELHGTYVNYLAFGTPDSPLPGAQEYVPFIIRQADSPLSWTSAPLCPEYVWWLKYTPSHLSGFDSSIRTIQVWRRANKRWYPAGTLSDSVLDKVRFSKETMPYCLNGHILHIGRPGQEQAPVAVLLPLPDCPREIEALPCPLDITMCLRTLSSPQKTWYIRHGEWCATFDFSPLPPEKAFRSPRFLITLPSADGGNYKHTLSSRQRVLVSDVNADNLPDITITPSDVVFYGSAERGGSFYSPPANTRSTK